MIVLALLFSSSFSHLVFNTPETWGISNSVSLEQPMDSSTFDFVCAGKSPETTQGVITLVAGQSYNFQTICGELDTSAQGCLVGDWHAGSNANDNSGCVLGVAYSDYTLPQNHKFMTYQSQCPLRDTPVSFNIPLDTPACEKCVCSWGWIPSRDYSSPAQFYHNCFYCNIVSSSIKTPDDMTNYEFINSAVSQYKDITYNIFFSGVETSPITQTPPIQKENTKKYKKYKKYKEYKGEYQECQL